MKRKNLTRNTLLTSIISLLLCVSMLVGTTFAWFTDEVKSGNNVIAAGNLDIDVMYANTPDGIYTSIENVADLFVAPIGATKGLWEPGHTEVAYLKVVNNGTLALKYQFMVDAASEVIGKSVLGNDIKLSEILKFAATEPSATAPVAYDRATAQAAAEASDSNLLGYTTETQTLAPGAAHYIALVVYMPESTDNKANYRGDAVPTINFKLTALATQVEAENDSFGDDYDENAWDKAMKVYSEQDLNTAIANGEPAIMLGADVVLTDNTAVTIDAGKSIALNLNGYKLSGNNTKDAGAVLVNNGTLSIYGGEMTNNAANGGAVIDNKCTLTLDGVTVQGGAKGASGYPEYAIVSYGYLTIENGTAVTSDRGAILLRGSGNTTINGGDFTVTDAFNGSVMTLHTITARDDSNLVIYGGNFENNYNGVSGASVICPYGGDITIYGGNFRDAMDDASNFNNTANFQNYMGAGSVVNVYGGTYDDTTVNKNVATGYKAIENNGVYYVVPDGVSNVVTSAAQLQAGLDAATGDTLLVLAADITGDVTVTQKEGVNIVIDGKNYKYDGTVTIDGAARYTGAETLKIQNINFETEKDGVDFISANVARQYAHNVTIEKCTFTNKGEGTVVPARFRQAYDITMKDCIVEGTFSPLWTTGVMGLTIDNVTANCANEGITVGVSDNVLIENCTITVPGAAGFGIRTDATADYKMTVNNCTLNAAKAIVIRGSADTYTVTVDGGKYVGTTEELINAIKNAPVGSETTIVMADGVYDDDINITVAALGAAGGDVVIKPMKGAKPVITGTVTLGYRDQGTGATMYNANVTFEGITFDHADKTLFSIEVGDVKSLNLVDCTIIAAGETGIHAARGNGTGPSKITGCTFINAAIQGYGNYCTGLIIECSTFNNSRINVQAGNGVTVQNCEFNNTLTAANVDDSFYAIRSNSTPITVKKCEINIDSELTEVATAQAKWYLLANRGTTNWTVEDVAVTLSDAALAQTELVVTACPSTGMINTINLTVNGVQL